MYICTHTCADYCNCKLPPPYSWFNYYLFHSFWPLSLRAVRCKGGLQYLSAYFEVLFKLLSICFGDNAWALVTWQDFISCYEIIC